MVAVALKKKQGNLYTEFVISSNATETENGYSSSQPITLVNNVTHQDPAETTSDALSTLDRWTLTLAPSNQLNHRAHDTTSPTPHNSALIPIEKPGILVVLENVPTISLA